MPDLTKLRRYRDDLQDARFSGVREVVDQNGEKIRWATDAELARAIAAIDSEIAALTRRRASLIYLQTSKGL